MGNQPHRDGNGRPYEHLGPDGRSVGDQVGARHAWMRRDAGQAPALRLAPPIELDCEHEHGELRLRIDREGFVAMAVIEIVEPDLARAVRDAGQLHDAGVRRLQQRQQSGGQHEMGQVVRPELHLEAVRRGRALPRRHDAGVVDQNVDWTSRRQHAIGESCDRGQAGQVEEFETHLGVGATIADQSFGVSPLGRVASSQNDLRPRARQTERRVQSETASRSRDHSEPAGVVGNIAGGPGRHVCYPSGWNRVEECCWSA
jgi:hypothetical protein